MKNFGIRDALFGTVAVVALYGAVPAGAGQVPAGTEAVAALTDAENKVVGRVELTQASDGLVVNATVSGLKPGSYGFHLHGVGKCDKPDFTSAGAHWNPTGRKHGTESPQGHHMGDLPNLVVAASGSGTLQQKIPGARLKGGDHPLIDADGAAVVLHAGPDDYKTDPAGASGSRIACGVITPQQ